MIFQKYILRLIDLIKKQVGLNETEKFHYLGLFKGKEYFLNKDIIYIITYSSNWTLETIKNQLNTINLADLYSVRLLKEYPKSPDDIELKVIIKSEKYNYTKDDFLIWIDEPSEITEEIDLPYYEIIKFLKTNSKAKNKLERELIKQTLEPGLILHEWSCHRIFAGRDENNKPKKFTNIWVYDFPKNFEEPYFFLTDSPYLKDTTKIAVFDFKTPVYHKEDYDKGIYKRGNIKRKLWKPEESYIKELMEFLKSPSTQVDENYFLEEYVKYYKKYVKTKWQELIFEYNHNSAGWGWGDTGFSIPPEKDTDRDSSAKALSFDLPIPDYTKINKYMGVDK